MPEPTSLEREFETYARQLGLPPFVTQYQFMKARRFRFDVAWPGQLVAVELEGGTWVNGWHNSAAGYEKDAEKYNLAACLNWIVLRFTTSMLRNDPAKCIGQIRQALEMRVNMVRDDPARCLGQVMAALDAPVARVDGPDVRPELRC